MLQKSCSTPVCYKCLKTGSTWYFTRSIFDGNNKNACPTESTWLPKANTVTNTNWGLHRDTGPGTDVFVRDKLCLLPVSLVGPLRNFVLSNSSG